MGEILTAAAYLKTLRQSELIEEAELERLLREFRDAGVVLDNPQALADAFVTRRVLTRWQADMLLAGKHRGFFLGKYRLLSLLGQGGMGAVYLAEHRMMRRRVAIKVLPPRKSGNAEFVARFRREARAAATLDHVNIVRMYDIDQDQDKDTVVHFLVMEYVEGGSLQDLVNTRGPLDLLTAAGFIRQAADGLAHAHAAGVVHRDVSPGNVLVDSSGTVKILDLGLAQFYRDATAGAPSDVGHHYLGTADYLAPEQALDSTSVDPRTDLYALGCTFYFLLAGHPPFPGGTATQKLIAHQTFEPKPIEQQRPDIPESLSIILRRMMAKNRDARWQSATELSQALRNWTEGQTTKPRRERNASMDAHARTPTQSSAANPRKPSRRGGPVEQLPRGTSDSAGPAGSGATQSTTSHGKSSMHAERRQTQPRLPLILTGTALVLLVSCLVVYSIRPRTPHDVKSNSTNSAVENSSSSKSDQPTLNDGGATGPPESRAQSIGPADPLNVTVGPKGDFRTLQAAIDHVRSAGARRPGRSEFVVRVAGGTTYPERILIDNSDFSFPDRVRFVSEGDKKAILAPSGNEPVIKLTGRTKGPEHFILDGFKISADGKPVAIELSGYLVGTTLLNLEIEGFSRTGLLGHDVRGLGSGRERDQFVVDRTLFRGAPDSEGMRITGAKSGHLRIHQCRFLGPMKTGILLRDGLSDIRIGMNIFCSTDQGVYIGGIGPELRDVLLENNAFHRNRRAIAFATFPAATSHGLSFHGNLFLELAGYECSVDGPSDASAFLSMIASGGIRENWSDRPKDRGPSNPTGTEIDLFQQNGRRGAEFQFKSLDYQSPDFLIPVAEAPHRSLGPFPAK